MAEAQLGGNASAYFRIWIVNVFLTILTLGRYSPWAKERRCIAQVRDAQGFYSTLAALSGPRRHGRSALGGRVALIASIPPLETEAALARKGLRTI